MKDLDQEKSAAKSTANGNFAPAYRALRSDRYLYILYANKQAELYDMRRDPAQVRNLAGNRRFRPVRKWLLTWMTGFSTCARRGCTTEIGGEPPPGIKPPEPRSAGKRKGKSKRPKSSPKR